MYGNGNGDDPLWTNGFSPTNATVESAIRSDPLFAGPTDYHLQPGSPACGAGLSDPRYPSHDRDGQPFASPRAIGAHECD